MKDHVLKVVCGNNREYYEYLINVAALMIQRPAEPAEVCVVLKGEEGVGKGIFLRALLKIMGQHGLYLAHPEHLRGRHNAHLWDCVMLFADEAFYAGDKQHEGVLKALITEEYLLIEPKFRDLFAALNHLHIWMASNSSWVVPVGIHGRRWFILQVADNRLGDHEYFGRLAAELDNGGAEAMLYELQRRDLAGFNPRIVPETAAYLEQRAHSLDTLQRWWLAVLEREYLWRSKWGIESFRRWEEFYSFELLVSSYLQWCDDHHLFQRQSRAELKEMMGLLYGKQLQPRGAYPIGEIEQLPPGFDRGSRVDWAAPELALAEPAADDDDVPDQVSYSGLEAVAVVRKTRPRGYECGDLELARDRFLEIVGMIPTAWRE